MPISPVQKTAIEEVVESILNASKGKRLLSAMFMDLVDRNSWPQYYEVIPEPRCLKNIQIAVAKGRYKEATDVYTDLSLVFWNALFYNEVKSQIAVDAETLKNLLETEWKKRHVLPTTRSSPPPSSAQKVHGMTVDNGSEEGTEEVASTSYSTTTASTPTPGLTTPALSSAHNATAPTASTSSNNYAYARPIPIRPKSAQPPAVSEADVDVIGQDSDGQEEDLPASQAERDPQSEEIVKQLEKGLPRWPGFIEHGWMNDVNPDRFSDIVHNIKSYKDIVGNKLAVALESVPEESSATLHLSSTSPVSLKQIETRSRHKMYKSTKEFDLDMTRLFEKARRWHDPGTEAYGRSLLLQRLYHALTSSTPPVAPFISSTNFAASKTGPGNVKPVHGADCEGVPNVTTHRVLNRDRTFVDELNYKGWNIKLADWVHLSNPDDPSRPIIGQVFRCWISDEIEKKGQPGVTVSWYYRPEQTFHPATRQFWEGEVFKTSHFADHPVEDVIEKIACQFTARHIRGRPRPPFWWVGFPLYVCDSRYNDRDRVFVRIKNWNSCVPEEVRQSTEFMPIYPFEQMVYPVRLPSPFLTKGAGKAVAKTPGGIISAPPEPVEEESPKKRTRNDASAPAPTKTVPLVPNAVTATATSTSSPYQTSSHLPQPINPRPLGPDRSVVTAAGGLSAIGGAAQVEKLPPETAKLFDRDPETNEVLWFPAPPMNMPRAKGARHSLAYLQFRAKKRKQTEDGPNGDIGGDINAPKRARVLPTVMETMKEVWKEMMNDS